MNRKQPNGHRRSGNILLSTSPAEYEKLRRAAELRGRPLATWCRDVALAEADLLASQRVAAARELVEAENGS